MIFMSDHRQSSRELQEKHKFRGSILPYSDSGDVGKGLRICILKVIIKFSLIFAESQIHRIHKINHSGNA